MTKTSKNRFGRTILCAASALAMTAYAAPAFAQSEERQEISIASQPLGDALLEIGERYDVSIIVSDELTRGLTAPSVSGTLTADQAIGRVLRGSRLSARRSANGAFIIQESVPAAGNQIVVTGTKQNRSVQDTVESVAIFTQEDIREQALFNVEDTLLRTPNVSTSGGATLGGLSIRGITLNGDESLNQGAAANVYLDGTPAGRRGLRSSFNLWDIQQVEILRGPQSTTQGRNALAGAVVIRSADPEYQFGASARGLIGNEEQYQISGLVTGPIIEDQIAFRLAADYREFDFGVINPDFGTRSRFQEALDLRAKLLIEPEALENLSLKLTANFANTRLGDSNRTVPPGLFGTSEFEAFDPFGNETFANQGPVADNETLRLIADVEYDLGANWSLVGLVSYDQNDENTELAGGGGFFSFDERTYQGELRAVFDYDRLSGWIGGYYFDQDSFGSTVSNFDLAVLNFPTDPPGAILSIDNRTSTNVENAAIFFDLNYELSDRWVFGVGARYDWETFRDRGSSRLSSSDPDGAIFTDQSILLPGQPIVSFTGNASGQSFTGDYEAFLPRASMTYRISGDQSISISAARGYRAGGAFLFSAPGEEPETRTFDPEFISNYEIAFRSQWPELGITFNANVFYSDWTDQQVFILGPSRTAFDRNIVNAGSSEFYGIEAAAQWQIATEWQVFANAGVLETEFTDFPFAIDANGDPLNAANPEFANLNGNAFAAAPNFNASVGFARSPLEDGLIISANASYSDGQFSDVTNLPENVTDSFFLVNARIGYRIGPFEASVFANNLFDERFIQRANLTEVSLQTGAVQNRVNIGFAVNNPRLYGVEVRVDF